MIRALQAGFGGSIAGDLSGLDWSVPFKKLAELLGLKKPKPGAK